MNFQLLATSQATTALRTDWMADLQDGIDSFFKPIASTAEKWVFYPIDIMGNKAPIVVLWLIVAAIVCTVYFGFLQFRTMRVSFDTMRGKYSRPDDPGEVSHFQALTSALSGTVGLGNIAGVGVAMAIGGAGATFWMILAGLLGMATKFAECTLGVKYREVHADGTVSGGPFKYLPIAFRRFGKLGAGGLTGVYTIAILLFALAGGNMFQSNQTVAQIKGAFGGGAGFLTTPAGAFLIGAVLASLVALVIMGGMSSIGKVTSRLIPAMAAIYAVACLTVIGVNYDHVPAAIGAIFAGAFNAEGVAGGVLGVMIIGFQRAAFSNEAGLGSAAIAHSAVKTRRPVSEGFVAMFEPFVDTVVVCTMTALAVIIADAASFRAAFDQVQSGGPRPSGVPIVSDAFATVMPWFPMVLALAVTLFAFSTLITWSYYGQQAWFKLFGRSKVSDRTFKSIFCSFTVIGAVLSFGQVLVLADSALFVCGFINLLGVYFMLPVIKREMKAYLRDRKEGTLAPVDAPPPTGSATVDVRHIDQVTDLDAAEKKSTNHKKTHDDSSSSEGGSS